MIRHAKRAAFSRQRNLKKGGIRAPEANVNRLFHGGPARHFKITQVILKPPPDLPGRRSVRRDFNNEEER